MKAREFQKNNYFCFTDNTELFDYVDHNRLWKILKEMGILNSSVGKESTCKAGDPYLVPGSARSTGEGIGYPLQYSWASFVAQLVKDLSAMRETWVLSLGWEDPLEKGMATHSSILTWRIPWTGEPGGLQSTELQTAGHN